MKNIILTLIIMSSSTTLFAGEKIDKTLDMSEAGNVSITDMNGQMDIQGWNKAMVKVSGELSDSADGYVFENQGGDVVFEVEYPKKTNSKNWLKKSDNGSKLKIYVPVKSYLNVDSINGDIIVSNVKGGSSIESINGTITAENLARRITLQTINGDIKANKLNGKIDIESVNGSVTDKLSEGEVDYSTVQGDVISTSRASSVEAESVNGDIDMKLGKIHELEIEVVNGEVVASMDLMKKGEVSASSVSGSIQLLFNKNISAKFDVNAFAGGSITNNLTEDKIVKPKYGPGRSLSFTRGDGSGSVEIETVSGKIVIETK